MHTLSICLRHNSEIVGRDIQIIEPSEAVTAQLIRQLKQYHLVLKVQMREIILFGPVQTRWKLRTDFFFVRYAITRKGYRKVNSRKDDKRYILIILYIYINCLIRINDKSILLTKYI